MQNSILRIENLNIVYKREQVTAVKNVTISIKQGESVGLIGESGSGKSSLALAVMGLLNNHAEIDGGIWYKDVKLSGLKEHEMNKYRWKRISIIFQNSLDILNPVLTVGEQIAEVIRKHCEAGYAEAEEKAKALLAEVGIDSLWYKSYPHQLSGGMRQKVLIAMAMSCEPEVLLIDEPTMALDAVSKEEIVKLLIGLRDRKKYSLLVISHELSIVAAMTNRMLVMYRGNIVEEGLTGDILDNPMHPYTRGLIYSSPEINPYRDMWGIPEEIGHYNVNYCMFFNRCNQRIDSCSKENPKLEHISKDRRVACCRGGIVTLLSGKSINKNYKVKDKKIVACSSCEIDVKMGEVVALIGESGSGKTTIAEILAGIRKADSGKIFFENSMVYGNSETSKIGGIQIVFQDPLSATNEKLTVEEIVREPLDIIKYGTKDERMQAVRRELRNVQLPNDDLFLRRHGFSLSGGQRQRVAIARALVMKPKLMIADEISAMLDPSTAANILRLLKGLQVMEGFAMIYISHDLAIVQKIADKIYIMHKGEIVEQGPARQVLSFPKVEYTKKLLCSAGMLRA